MRSHSGADTISFLCSSENVAIVFLTSFLVSVSSVAYRIIYLVLGACYETRIEYAGDLTHYWMAINAQDLLDWPALTHVWCLALIYGEI